MSPIAERVSTGARLPPSIDRGAPHEMIEQIRRGVPAVLVAELSHDLGLSRVTLAAFLGLSYGAVGRRIRIGQSLPPAESERVLGVQRLIVQVHTVVEESGSGRATGFDAARWLGSWLREPIPALGRQPPGSYLDTMEGQKFISNVLALAQSGAYM